ncbi:MAG: hypothetical protein R2849_18055 [Thermomicrobiales bacterium]
MIVKIQYLNDMAVDRDGVGDQNRATEQLGDALGNRRLAIARLAEQKTAIDRY